MLKIAFFSKNTLKNWPILLFIRKIIKYCMIHLTLAS